MKIRFHTNLDLAQQIVYFQTRESEFSNVVPRVGERIRFDLSGHAEHLHGHHFDLEVCGVVYLADGKTVIVELHMPRVPAISIPEWEDRFKRRLRGDP